MQYYKHDTSIIDQGAIIGKGTKVWHFTHIMGTAQIGEHCILGQNVFVGEQVILGNGVKVQNNVSLYNGVICADDVFIGPSVVFTNVINPRSFIERKSSFFPTKIEKGASIGANATLICGITIGAYALVGAGSVVTKDVSPYELVVGNPAKRLGWISEHGEKLVFNQENIAVCSVSGEKYRKLDNQVYKISQDETRL